MVLVVGEQRPGREVRAEEIAREKDFVFAQEAEHGLGPMHPRSEHELQAAAAEIQDGAIGDDFASGGRNAQVRSQEIRAFLVGYDLDARKAFKGLGNTAGMVLLGVVAHHVVELGHA